MRRSRPFAQGLEPFLVVNRFELDAIPCAFIVGKLAVEPVFQALGFVLPALGQSLQSLRHLLALTTDQLAQTASSRLCRNIFTRQRLHVANQGAHMRPDAQNFFQQLTRQRITLLAPVVLRGFHLALAFIGLQRFIKQVAAIKSMFAQHALAPGINGVNGSVIHALRRHVEPPGCVLALCAGRVTVAQLTQKGIKWRRLGLATKALHGFHQTMANTV